MLNNGLNRKYGGLTAGNKAGDKLFITRQRNACDYFVGEL